MNLQVPITLIDSVSECLAVMGKDDAVAKIKRNKARYGNPDSVEVPIHDVGLDGLNSLYDLAKSRSERGLMMEISGYRNIMESPFTSKVGKLKSLIPGLVAFMKEGLIDGWLYSKEDDGVHLPWLVKSIQYEVGKQMAPPSVYISLVANVGDVDKSNRSRDAGRESIRFSSDDIIKKTIPELLASRGYFHETQELKEQYEKDVELFAEYRMQFGKQFSGCGKGVIGTGYRKTVIDVTERTRLVNDEEEITRQITEEVDSEFWEGVGLGEEFSKMPFHCRLYMFHLDLHENLWVHVSSMLPYVYKPELREKLILPDLHRDLIDILTSDMGVIMEDIVVGKSGGTTILCKGAPGLGKTLTAEVYSEVVQKPLYRVHSGQLGIDAETVEKSLSAILMRAQRWGAVLLLDEADVFVRARDNDISHNAVVASFLRTLEYFSGLLFMTTNRAKDIDDAILSRCIAIITYESPSAADAKKLWRVLSKQFEVELSDSLIDELIAMIPKASGRDIKELLKLTSKFIRHKKLPVSTEVFRQCGMFRGIV